MNLLALETSTLACSVALQSGDTLSFRHELKARQHTQLLLPMINELLTAASLRARDLDAVILGNGPGSFIGMRIAASVAQGISFATGAALVPVSSLQALAVAALSLDDCGRVLVAQDARMNEVYLEGFAPGAEGLPASLAPVRLQRVGRIDDLPERFCAAGAGWQHYPELWEKNRDRLVARVAPDFPHARDLVTIGAVRLREGGAIAPENLEPAYVRDRIAARPGETKLQQGMKVAKDSGADP